MIQTQANNLTWGIQNYGGVLHINEGVVFNQQLPLVLDVEDNEEGKFVGVGFTQDGVHIYYFTEFAASLEGFKLIGQNVKYDLKQLMRWSIKLSSDQLYFDTALASYVQNATKESHSLKILAKEILSYEWPTYKEMVHPDGSTKKKVTLDQQDVERVASYNAMDVMATYHLWKHFQKVLTVSQTQTLEQLELPTARALLGMELTGVRLDLERVKNLDVRFKLRLDEIQKDVLDQWQKLSNDEFNINSNRQVAELLTAMGAELPKTEKGNLKVNKQTLEQWAHLPIVPTLLEHSKIEKLYSTYTQPLQTQHKNGRIHTTYNQISKNAQGNEFGIATGRLSSSNPNLQNIPTRTIEGQELRKCFIAKEGFTLIDADYSQIEYRLLAHFTGEFVLLNAFYQDKDVHEETGAILGADRSIGKTINFAAIYGAQAKKIANTAKLTEQQAQKFLDTYWHRLPKVTAWIERVKWQAHKDKGVTTLSGRFLPLPAIDSKDRYEKLHAERAAVNYVIQGSAAEVLKAALCKLRTEKLLPMLTVHDEFLFEVRDNECTAKSAKKSIKQIMENVVKLKLPLKVDVGCGNNWYEAKQ